MNGLWNRNSSLPFIQFHLFQFFLLPCEVRSPSNELGRKDSLGDPAVLGGAFGLYSNIAFPKSITMVWSPWNDWNRQRWMGRCDSRVASSGSLSLLSSPCLPFKFQTNESFIFPKEQRNPQPLRALRLCATVIEIIHSWTSNRFSRRWPIDAPTPPRNPNQGSLVIHSLIQELLVQRRRISRSPRLSLRPPPPLLHPGPVIPRPSPPAETGARLPSLMHSSIPLSIRRSFPTQPRHPFPSSSSSDSSSRGKCNPGSPSLSWGSWISRSGVEGKRCP